MKINFVKMNSQGNDFIIIDNTKKSYKLTKHQITKICSRENIGCDQLLILDVKDSQNIICKIFNQDGSEASQCGNGMRAIMFFLYKYYKYTDASIVVKDLHYPVHFETENDIRVNMGKPKFLANHETSFSYSPLMLGNFHCIIYSDDCYNDRDIITQDLYDIYEDVPNISFILNFHNYVSQKDNYIKIKVNERGAGWTKSCGSGASATAAFVFNNPKLIGDNINKLLVEQDGGRLAVMSLDHDIYLSGPTTFEYDGSWND